MNSISRLTLLISGFFLLSSNTLFAQDAPSDEANVWTAIEAQWDADQNGDKKWTDRLLTENFSGWPNNAPAPRSKTSTKMWDRFNDEQGSIVAHELYPLAIVVNGDVAIAHYLYTQAFKDTDDAIEVNNGRFTDILIRTEDGWKFIAWHGGDD